MPQIIHMMLIGAGAAFFSCLLIYATRQYHKSLTFDWVCGAQKVHLEPTSRVGGIAVLIGFVVGGIALTGDMADLWWGILIAALPAFFGGLAEDISNKVGVKIRLFATLASGLIFTLLTGYVLKNLGILGADWLLSSYIFAICFTAFAIGGIANAINIVDGFHGLATGTVLIALFAFGCLAWKTGDIEMLGLIGLSFAVVATFTLFNFPKGLLFLGDSGAYLLGVVIASFAVALPARNPEIAPLTGLVVFGYPVMETLFSMLRRKLKEGGKVSEADGRHLHSLIYSAIAPATIKSWKIGSFANPLTSLIIMPFPIACMVLAFIGNQTPSLIPLSLLFVVWTYLLVYRRVDRFLVSRETQTPVYTDVSMTQSATAPAG